MLVSLSVACNEEGVNNDYVLMVHAYCHAVVIRNHNISLLYNLS